MAIEAEYVDPESYFTQEAARNYDRSSRMRIVQRSLAERALEFLGIEEGSVLDVGCGTGFSMQVFAERGFDVAGIDVAGPMVEIAKRKGLNVTKADFTALPFPDASLDAVVSFSALQWIHGRSAADVMEKYRSVAHEFYRVLKPKARAVVYVHAKTPQEIGVLADAFSKAGFTVQRAIDYPEVAKKRKEYILLKKEK